MMGKNRLLVKLRTPHNPTCIHAGKTAGNGARDERMERLKQDLLDMLVCPKCRMKVRQTGKGLLCTNADCRLLYRIDNNIPVMLIEEAVRSDDTRA